jgi:4a-hydroxytetrahydrobiopterin dehydratase
LKHFFQPEEVVEIAGCKGKMISGDEPAADETWCEREQGTISLRNLTMTCLAGRKCEACRKDAPLATDAQIEQYLSQLPGWRIKIVGGIKRLEKHYNFDNFEQSLRFTVKVGAIAEQEQHHPAILTEWGKVTVSWWTHKISGLHVNDFIMAAKTDEID